MALTYISICDLSRPEGSRWVGGIYVECDEPDIEVRVSTDPEAAAYVRTEHRNRLLSLVELRQTGPDGKVYREDGTEVA